jgi:hypothetical protein
MTIQATAWAWEQDLDDAEERLVLLALADESSDHAPPPDLDHIAQKVGVDRAGLDLILAELRKRALVDLDSRTAVR